MIDHHDERENDGGNGRGSGRCRRLRHTQYDGPAIDGKTLDEISRGMVSSLTPVCVLWLWVGVGVGVTTLAVGLLFYCCSCCCSRSDETRHSSSTHILKTKQKTKYFFQFTNLLTYIISSYVSFFSPSSPRCLRR